MADADGDEEPWKSIGEPAATVPGNEAQPRPGREVEWRRKQATRHAIASRSIHEEGFITGTTGG